MRLGAVAIGSILVASVFVGCLGGDDEKDASDGDVDPTRVDDVQPGADGEPAAPAPDDAGEDDSATQVSTAVVPLVPMAVVAHIDTGVNPYHLAFRDTSPLARVHPSLYLPGYPADTPALELTLGAASFEDALAADAAIWESVEEETLYWIPGTRIVGAISFGGGGTRGNITDAVTGSDVVEHRILDDHGHGTMTASRSTAATHSLCPTCRLVTIEGLGPAGVRWAADQGWIDVQTNSWGSLLPHPTSGLLDPGIPEAFAYAGARMVTVEASGNGAGGFNGFVPCPTYTWAQGPPGVILVGGHDNGYVAAWSCSPPHVVADGFRPWAAIMTSLHGMGTHGYSCCTSASAPYAAGAAAGLIVEARTILGDLTPGVADGVLAQGAAGAVTDGPLADGDLTLAELKDVLLKTAQARPVGTDDDGEAHWLSSPGSLPRDPTSPGDNQYCPGCWSLFVPYDQIPPEVPAYAYVGYGAINIFSDHVAREVLAGVTALPQRAEDEFYGADQQVRDVLFGACSPVC